MLWSTTLLKWVVILTHDVLVWLTTNVVDVANQLIVKYTTVHSLLVIATVYISMFIAQHTLEPLDGRRIQICVLKNFYTDNGK